MTRRRFLLTMCAWGVVVISLWVSHSHPAILVLGGIVAVVAAVILVMVDYGGAVSRVMWTRLSDQGSSTRDTDLRVSSIRHQIYRARLSGSTHLSDTLVDLLDDRLFAHHRITRAVDPRTADRMLTPSLRRLVAGPRRQTATVRELRQILTEIEAL